MPRLLAISLLAALIVVSLLGARCAARSDAAAELGALEPYLEPGSVLLLGEIHGTAEVPRFVSRVVARALARKTAVTVALEMPAEEAPRIDGFLASAGTSADLDRLLAGSFWNWRAQEGRQSEAMIELLDDLRLLRARDEPLEVVLIDRSGVGGADREQHMAQALAAAVAPERFTIALVGNNHARLSRGAVPGIGDPMGFRARELLPETRFVALKLSHSGGTAWFCGGVERGCGVRELGARLPVSAPFLEIDETLRGDGYHGVFHLGAVHASPPAVEGLRTLDSARPRPAPAAARPVRAAAATPRQPSSTDGPDWPQWMGPLGTGGLDAGLLPAEARIALALDWRQPISNGHSSLTVAGGRVFTLELAERSTWALALDAGTGAELWRTRLAEPPADPGEIVEAPSATPASDGARVFALDAAARLFALDAASGELLWRRDLVRDFDAATPSYGMATSPVVGVGKLFLLAGGRRGNNLIAFDPVSGDVLYSSGEASRTSYSTPVLVRDDGKKTLVVPGDDQLYALDPESGEVRWRFGEKNALPYPDRSPLPLAGHRLFLAFQEHAAMLEVSREKSRELWRSEHLGNSYSPAAAHDGAIFGFGGRALAALDAAEGSVLWQHDMPSGSLVRVDDHLVIFDSLAGMIRIVEARRDRYREVTALEVLPPRQPSPTPPSFGAGRIFVRGQSEVVAVRVSSN